MDTDKKIAELTHDLAGMSLDLYERQTLVRKKDERIIALEKNLKDIQGRLKLSQRLIDEKDKNIDALKKGVLDTNLSLEPGDAGKIPAADLVRIQDIERKFKSLKKQYTYLKKRMDIRDKEINQLYGITDIYRWKLHETYADLQKKEERLDHLEQQLRELKITRTPHAIPKVILKENPAFSDESTRQSENKLYIDEINFWNRSEILNRAKNSLKSIQRIHPGSQAHKSIPNPPEGNDQ